MSAKPTDGAPSPTGATTQLVATIRSEIRDLGPLTFARFMELALYAPGLGYYDARAAEDFRRDYVTSPELHPAFGVLLCGQFEEMWRRLGRPPEFWLVEGGPGSGALAADVLATAEDCFPAFANALRVKLIERSPNLCELQKQRVSPWLDRVSWLELDDTSVAPVGVGCVFTNELLDALPVHRVVMREDGLREIRVDGLGHRFTELEEEPSTSALEAQVADGGGRLRVGDRGEVNVAAPLWVRAAARLIDRGYMLLLDYGEPATLLYGAGHPRGTLRCYWRQTMNEDPYARVGSQDITAHVDLSPVARAGEDMGFSLLGATYQARLLDRLGIGAIRRTVDREISSRVERRAHHAALDLLTDRRHLGRITALVLGKAVPGESLVGLSGGGGFEPPVAPRVLDLRILDAIGLVEALRGWRVS
jgi:SAM-dependent MidA family methyltransferase